MSGIHDKVILVTGATDGLGRMVATRLAAQGATVLLHGRDPAKGAAVMKEIKAATGSNKLRYYNADFAALAEVRQLAREVRARESQLDVLVNNAGIGPRSPGSPRQLSKDGHELLFAVNYLAGYLLTRELLPLLLASAPARIVSVASIGQQELDFSNVMLAHDYDDARAYRQSKLAQIMFTFDLAEQLAGTGVTVNCLHPATLMNTRMVHDSSYFPGVKSTTEQGAAALENLITASALATCTGEYFDGMQKARAKDQAYEPEARKQLRELSEQLVATSP